MSRLEHFALSFTRRWVSIYTRSLPNQTRDRRTAEIESDLWEHRHSQASRGRVGGDILARCLSGMVSDLAWRRTVTGGTARRFGAATSRAGRALTRNWWMATVVVLAVNSAVFALLFMTADEYGWALLLGFSPAALLTIGLLIRPAQRTVGTILLLTGSLLAAGAFWAMYTVVLAAAILAGGFTTGKLGRRLNRGVAT